MTRLVVGRFGLEVPQANVSDLKSDIDGISISGRLSHRPGLDLDSLVKQLREMEKGMLVPVYISSDPGLAGMYTIESAGVSYGGGSAVTGWLEYDITLSRPVRNLTPNMESSIFGKMRPNDHGQTIATLWHAVPMGTTAYGDPLGQVEFGPPEIRMTEDGPLRVYTGADSYGPTDMISGQFVWRPDAREYMDGAARVRVGQVDVAASTVFTSNLEEVQDYVVPAGVTRLRVDVRGSRGGGPERYAGYGARVVCEIEVTPAETLKIYAGRIGDRLVSSGGWPNGGDPGVGGATSSLENGFAGGGRSEIRRGSTSLVIAGGGGGSPAVTVPRSEEIVKTIYGDGSLTNPDRTVVEVITRAVPMYRAGHGGRFGGSAQDTEVGGKGGTATSGGLGGVAVGSGNSNGSNGSSKLGGAGGESDAAYGGGGGGDGLFGGGGGAATPVYMASGGGGGGSSMGTGLSETIHAGANNGAGIVIITPIDPTKTEMPARLFTTSGTGTAPDPYGWEISNGIISIGPSYRGDVFMLNLKTWSNGQWSDPVRFQLNNNEGSSTPHAAGIVGMQILRNAPEVCVVQATLETADRDVFIQVTITLRRGACIADVRVEAFSLASWGWVRASSETADVVPDTGFIIADAEDEFGNRWMIGSAEDVSSAVIGRSGVFLTEDADSLTVGLGAYPDGIDITVAQLIDQWYAYLGEIVRAVRS